MASDPTPTIHLTTSDVTLSTDLGDAAVVSLTTLQPRQSDRLTINKEFESFDAFIHEYVTNISKTGVFIKSKTPLAIGTQVNLRFTLIMDDIETIEGTGEVVRVDHEPSGMGIVFTELTAESAALVERLVGPPEVVAAE
jgi:uncharacterized protein (TIGR02266 family)